MAYSKAKQRRSIIQGRALWAMLMMLILLLTGCSDNTVAIDMSPLQESAYDTLLSAEKIRADAEELVRIVEETHPSFLEEPHEDYAPAKEAFLRAASEEMTLEWFYIHASYYIAALHDAHTSINRQFRLNLDFPRRWNDEGLFVSAEDILPEGSKIVSIAGVPIETLEKTIDSIKSYENESGMWFNRRNYVSRQFVHIAAGAEKASTAKIVYQHNGLTGEVDYAYNGPPSQTSTAPRDKSFEFASIDEGNIALITTRSCDLGTDLDNATKELKAALDKGVKNVIFDLRDNPGGNSSVWDAFYKVMNMKRNNLGSLRSYSPLAVQQISSYRGKSGTQRYQPTNEFVNNSDIKMIVLVNVNTFSSAMHFVAQVHDAKVATIIGTEPQNQATHYGYPINFRLTNSGFTGRISHVKWIRPDPSLDLTNPDVVDIIVPAGEDALDVAVAEFKKLG